MSAENAELYEAYLIAKAAQCKEIYEGCLQSLSAAVDKGEYVAEFVCKERIQAMVVTCMLENSGYRASFEENRDGYLIRLALLMKEEELCDEILKKLKLGE